MIQDDKRVELHGIQFRTCFQCIPHYALLNNTGQINIATGNYMIYWNGTEYEYFIKI